MGELLWDLTGMSAGLGGRAWGQVAGVPGGKLGGVRSKEQKGSPVLAPDAGSPAGLLS